jgi:membrane-bound lytic murein transglycosylase B
VKPITTTITALLLAGCALQATAAVRKPLKKASATGTAQASGPRYAARPDVMQQAQDIALRRNLDLDWVRQALGQARFMPGIAKAILPPPVGVPKNWALYRSRFVEPLRIKAGTQFWLANRDTLQRAEAQTGVPAQIIVGIVGVETIYGQNIGNFRVIDALSTLAFDFPAAHPKAAARAAFFRSELEEYLALTARTHTDPLALRGSYAGAMGWPQFMPSSWSRYAIDFDGDDRVDLFNSQADVIGSVAHYFQAFHWQRGMSTHYAVHLDASTLDLPALLAPDILPSFSAAELAAKGALLDSGGASHSGPLALIALQNGAAPTQYLVGTENFYAITRYNWSSYYAMAVIELGQAVANAVAAQTPLAPQEPAPALQQAPAQAPDGVTK